MIKTELLREGTLIKHYSDKGYLLLQQESGIKYLEPVDLNPCQYTYVETDELAEDEDVTNEDYAEAGKILLGVSE